MASPADDLNFNELLIEFCADFVKKVQEKKKSLPDKESQVLLTLYGDQCEELAEEIAKLAGASGEHAVVKYLQKLSTLVLDMTYIDECELVEQNTIQDNTWQRVRWILDTLSSVEKLATKIFPKRELTGSLGEDIVECLWWRKGALLYMYCHMSENDKAGKEKPKHYRKCLEEGVDYFLSMLCVRSTPEWLGGDEEDEGEKSKNDKHNLAAEGIWSDNHLLAMMYCGEMCYWHTKHVKAASPEGAMANLTLKAAQGGAGNRGSTVACSNDIDVVKTGKVILEKFIVVAKWPMLAKSWNSKRAEELLAYLSKV